jgi:hypothetical protein
MGQKRDRDAEKAYCAPEFAAKLRRLAGLVPALTFAFIHRTS